MMVIYTGSIKKSYSISQKSIEAVKYSADMLDLTVSSKNI